MNQMIVLEWLFLTIAPCDAAEPWQLGSQDAATPIMQGIMDLHHDIFFFLILILVFVSRILVRVFSTKMYLSERIALTFPLCTIHLSILIIYLLACIATRNVAFCMDNPSNTLIIDESLSQDLIWNELDRNALCNRVKLILHAHEKIGEKILELRKLEGMRLPGGFQLERVVEMLEETHGGEKLLEIQEDIRVKGLRSAFYAESKEYFDLLRRNGATEALLRREWQSK